MENKNLDDEFVDPVYQLAVSPVFEKDRTCFAARGSGLYRSQDGGYSWQGVFDSLNIKTQLSSSCVALSPNYPKDGQVFAAVLGGVLRSDDRGDTWTVSIFPTPAPFITSLVISPNYKQDGVLLAGTLDDGILRSSNRGANWTAWNFGLFDPHILSLATSPNFGLDKHIYAGTESGVFRSWNGGMGWREVDFPMAHAPVLSVALSPNYERDEVILAGTENSGLFYSENSGKTWLCLTSEVNLGIINQVILSPRFPEQPEILLLTNDGLLVSRDGGDTWESWDVKRLLDDQILTVCAPNGIRPDSGLLVGLANGEIAHI